MSERRIADSAALMGVLGQVGITACGPLCEVEIETCRVEKHGRELGWMLRITFARPDRDTGEMGRGASHWELVEVGATESAVVKTVWVLCELTVKHELMEGFTYRGARIFDPHRTVDELSMPAIAGRGGAA